MRGYWAPTEPSWFEYLRSLRMGEDVNFWRPRARRFLALSPGAPLFFKLLGRDVVGGFGLFGRYEELNLLAAWDSFGVQNGAPDLRMLSRMIASKRGDSPDTPPRAMQIGCVMLYRPVFFEESDLVRRASEWKVQGAQGGGGFSLLEGDGRRLWQECQLRPASYVSHPLDPGAAWLDAPASTSPTFALREVRPGQRIFKASLIAAFRGACAITGEHSLPVLDAAHILPYSEQGPDRVTNGLLIRTDLHRLFDEGYVTVTPDRRFEVGRALRDQFDNGRTYYELRDELHGREIRLPKDPSQWPERAALEWHARERFLG